MRSYTNNDGMTVEVSNEHLDTAVEIKLELQNNSPSRKTNWSLHKKMMEEEGFNDSDTNEAYRCLVKDYQSKIGKLVSLDKHVDLVASSKLESIRSAVGELYYEKRTNQETLNELNKLKRDFVRTAVIAEEVRDAFLDKIELNVPHYIYKPLTSPFKTKAIVVITDWHIGVTVDGVCGNWFNLEIAKKRIAKLKQKVLDYCIIHKISEIEVCSLGDMVEHVNMRYKQNNEAEFKLARQIVEATHLIFDFITSLASHVNVTFTGIAGNHDRLQGDKDIAFDDDNVSVVINDNIRTLIQMSNAQRLKFCAVEDGATEIIKELNGRKIRLVHGHLDEGNKRDRIKSYISMENEFFDALIYGHLHNFKVEESDNGRLAVGVGCLVGRNSYSKKISCATNASQMIFVVTEDGDMLPIKIDLQNTGGLHHG